MLLLSLFACLQEYEDTGPNRPTLADMQTGDVPLGSQVEVDGVIVTGTMGFGAFVQEVGGGPAQGMWVYFDGLSTGPVDVGDVVDFTGTLDEFRDDISGQTTTQVNVGAGTFDVVGSDSPEATLVSSGELVPDFESFESVLITLQETGDLVVSDVGPAGFTFQGGVQVEDWMHVWSGMATVQVGDRFESVTGVVDYRQDHFRLLPRFDADVVPRP